ncbi:hypothetical protein [Lacihabitans lacunae]|uniref:Uncharacterized protein n=1 Tax=Lacihabitans lacunae TaxID=1028214 RepID=A0ABV7YS04_9BACT
MPKTTEGLVQQHLPKSGGSVVKSSFVFNQSLVLRINICGENRHLRQARKRWQQA